MQTQKSYFMLLVCSLIVLLCSSVQYAAEIEINDITDLGTLSGIEHIRGMHINSSGDISGQAWNDGFIDRSAVRWEYINGSWTITELEPFTGGAESSEPHAINDSSQAVGWAHTSTGVLTGAFWDSETSTPTLLQGTDTYGGRGYYINNAGQIAGVIIEADSPYYKGSYWESATSSVQVLPLYTERDINLAVRMNDDYIIGLASNATGTEPTRAIYWEKSGASWNDPQALILPSTSTWGMSQAWSINALNQMTGWAYNEDDSSYHLILWELEGSSWTVSDMGIGMGLTISDDGSMIVGSSSDHATYWMKDGDEWVSYDIYDALDGWTLYSIHDAQIINDEIYFVVNGINDTTGEYHGFVITGITPTTTVVPEPLSFLLLGISAVTAIRKYRSR